MLLFFKFVPFVLRIINSFVHVLWVSHYGLLLFDVYFQTKGTVLI